MTIIHILVPDKRFIEQFASDICTFILSFFINMHSLDIAGFGVHVRQALMGQIG